MAVSFRSRRLLCTILLQSLMMSAAFGAFFPDSMLNVTEVVWSGAEQQAIYLGSPSIVRTAKGTLLVSHDLFGSGAANMFNGYIYRSVDEGQTWAAIAVLLNQYWSQLFVVDGSVYSLGVSNNGNTNNTIVIQRSDDDGETWVRSEIFPQGQYAYSTGPTPVVQAGGRFYRALEINLGPWAAGYGSFVISAPVYSNLTDPASWIMSPNLPFANVTESVPNSWNSSTVTTDFGWLEGNAVADANNNVYIFLRVNSLPAANQAALLSVPTYDSQPVFVSWINFPGGMTKFAIRRDPISGLFVTLSNVVSDVSISELPACAATAPPTFRVRDGLPSCCGNTGVVSCSSCVWCHGNSRNILALTTSPDLFNWTVNSIVLTDDQGFPSWMSELLTGFQYVDWQFDGDQNENIVMAIRAAYRGANCAHNSNRILFKGITNWRSLTTSNIDIARHFSVIHDGFV